MANPRNFRPDGVGSRAAVEGAKMSESSKPAPVSTVAPIATPSKINEAAVSYSAYLRERGIDVSAEVAQIFWNEENVWRTSPERNAERVSRKLVADATKAATAEAKATAAKAKLERDRAALAAKAAALGITLG